MTATGVVLASVAYAAPETLTGTDVDGRADIYSLGCSLYRMLTAKTPFAGLKRSIRPPRQSRAYSEP
jgi:eukaryotic-like serine/threonine-protein kinase